MSRGGPPDARPARRLRLAVAALITLGTAALALGAADAPLGESLEGRTLDARFRLRGPTTPGPEVVIVALDDRSLAELGGWPPSRRHLARAVRRLTADGARVVAFDLLLLDPSPRPGDDRALADALAEADGVVLPLAFLFDPGAVPPAAVPPAAARAAYRVVRASPGRAAGIEPRPTGVVAPPGLLLDAAATTAHVNVLLEADGALRFVPLGLGPDEAVLPALPVEAARLYRGLDRRDAELRVGEGLRLGAAFVPTDPATRLPLDFRGPNGTFPAFSLVDLLRGRVPRSAVAGRIVLVGVTALGLGDSFVTPFDPRLAGVEVFATGVDDLLRGGGLRRDDATLALDLLAILAGGSAAAATAGLRRPLPAAAATLGLAAAWCLVAQAAFVHGRLWLGVVLPLTAILLNGAAAGLLRALGERRLLIAAEARGRRLARYLPDLAAGVDGAPAPADRRLLAAVLFVDLRGYTGMTEGADLAESAALMRALHGRIERVVRAHGGAIDRYMGDGALVLFGAVARGPGDGADPVRAAADALRAARALVADVDLWNREPGRRGRPPLRVSVGLHHGPVAVGEFGGPNSPQPTAVGDTVNVASRLERMTRPLDAAVVASEALIEAARAGGGGLDGFRPLPPQPVRGRDRPIAVWAWDGEADAPADAAAHPLSRNSG